MKVLQANMHRSRTADSLLSWLTMEHHSDGVIISEQPSNKKSGSFIEETTGTAAICLIKHSRLSITNSESGKGFVCISCNEVTLVSCYVTPSNNRPEFEEKLNDIENSLRDMRGAFVVDGDFNSKCTEGFFIKKLPR